MKKVSLSFLLTIFMLLSANSQTSSDIGKIVVGVSFPEGISAETLTYRQLIEDRLIKQAAQSGYATFGNSNFVIVPNIVVNSVDVAEGGMKDVFVVRGDIYLTIQDEKTGTVYSSESYTMKGSATKKETAIKNAILNISLERMSVMFDKAKENILSYFEKQKDVIFTNAEICANNGDFEQAITYLMMIPDDLTDIHLLALEKAQDIYDRREEFLYNKAIAERHESNNAILTEANSLLAMHNAQEALKVLWNYQQGDESLDTQYSQLISKAEKQISAAEREALRKEEREYADNRRREDRAWNEYKKEAAHQRNMDRADKAYRNQLLNASERVAHHKLNLSQQKVKALKDVACEYIRNNPNRVDYISVKY